MVHPVTAGVGTYIIFLYLGLFGSSRFLEPKSFVQGDTRNRKVRGYHDTPRPRPEARVSPGMTP